MSVPFLMNMEETKGLFFISAMRHVSQLRLFGQRRSRFHSILAMMKHLRHT